MAEESQPLLASSVNPGYTHEDVPPNAHGEDFDAVPLEKRQIGLTSAVFLIFNRLIGTGVFATPSLILRSSGSVGMALVMWALGALISSTGLAVYIEYGTGLPRSGGEKNYLEYVYRQPKFLITCMFAAYACLLGWGAGNSTIFGEYILHALEIPVNQWNQRLTGLACLTSAWLLHSFFLPTGIRLTNILGFGKLVILVLISLSGLGVLSDILKVSSDVKPDNFSHPWEGTGSLTTNMFVTALYNVTWSFLGYSNANYVMSEMKDPIRNIRRAGPIAMVGVTLAYFLVNFAYFAAVPKEEILGSGRIIAALYFRNVLGSSAEKVLSICVAMSALGNVLAVMFAQGRINQELAREGVLPFSKALSSNWPRGSPFAALGLQWIASATILLGPPPGDAYNFILNLVSYPLAIINAAISGGLIYLYLRPTTTSSIDKDGEVAKVWNPPFRATLPVVAFFFASNVFLSLAPLVKPPPGFRIYEHLPYYLHVVVGLCVFGLGALYWAIWTKILPKYRGYTLEREVIIQEDGVSRVIFVQKVL